MELCSGDCQKSSHLKFIRIFLLIQENKKNLFILVPVLHTHFPPYSSPRTNEYILVFPPERYVYTNFPPGKSVYTHLSPLIFRGEIWVYTEVSPSYSILPLCTDRLYNQRGRWGGGGAWKIFKTNILTWSMLKINILISKMEKKNILIPRIYSNPGSKIPQKWK